MCVHDAVRYLHLPFPSDDFMDVGNVIQHTNPGKVYYTNPGKV